MIPAHVEEKLRVDGANKTFPHQKIQLDSEGTAVFQFDFSVCLGLEYATVTILL